jgi:hypothetical protein
MGLQCSHESSFAMTVAMLEEVDTWGLVCYH